MVSETTGSVKMTFGATETAVGVTKPAGELLTVTLKYVGSKTNAVTGVVRLAIPPSMTVSKRPGS